MSLTKEHKKRIKIPEKLSRRRRISTAHFNLNAPATNLDQLLMAEALSQRGIVIAIADSDNKVTATLIKRY